MNGTVFIKDKKLNDVTIVDNTFIAGFMAGAPELALKAYLYGLMLLSSHASADTDVAAALGCTDNDLRAAFSYWEGLGLVTVIAEEPLQIKYNSAAEAAMGCAYRGGAKYAEFLKKLQSVLGTRQLSGRELAKIYDWIDVFGFEQDAAVAIVKRCLDKKGVRTSVNYMDSVAKRLAGQGALTLEQAQLAFAEEELMLSGAGKVLKRWNQTRRPTEDELILYEKWTHGWGFDDNAIMLACTHMVSAEKPSFAYLDGILTEWHNGGTVTKEQIAQMEKEDDSIRELTRQAFSRAGIKSQPSREQRQQVKTWVKEYAMSPELLMLAADYSKPSAKKYSNMHRLLEEWHEKGISSVGAAGAYYEAYQKFGTASATAKAASGKKNRALDYMQGGRYTREELKKLGVSMGEEFYSDDDE